ncbi:MAG: hypothetical protein BWY44_01211 [Candidatus Omnitrophica bacterium ADurb.Bin292]|jgi:hypothetical protein|nr:MAG: hypothetical protein BWY44_01211 [Candidatus Omnitrophica bacterium ADurb.Bin292]HOG23067.1 DUF5329 family protein [Candidatus Omnitrophota bacterium]HPW76696.1 DUF5329 family protein [Candidatus Omnitrophota bacterium]HQB11849.1 DUF5329 family protein [Candidatus Omnitrophota bacterium]
MLKKVFKEKSNKAVVLLSVVLLGLILAEPRAVFPEEETEAQDVCMLEKLAIPEESPAFRRLLKTTPATSEYQRARIDFLIERVGKSDFDFIWNGESFDGRRAAFHLKYKYVKFRSEAPTAEAFITSVASWSRKTGRPYLARIDGEICEVRAVLFRELARLDQMATEKRRETESLPAS